MKPGFELGLVSRSVLITLIYTPLASVGLTALGQVARGRLRVQLRKVASGCKSRVSEPN